MRNFKRFLTLALAVVMVASTFAFGASAAKFTDVDENNEYLAKAVNLLNYVGVAKGTSDTTFGTKELVTREQMAAFIYRLMKKGQSVEGGNNSSNFTDLEDPTFFYMVSWASSQNIIKGTSATTFDPKGSITLQDAYTMLVRALGYEKEEAIPYPFGYIDIAEQKGVTLDKGLSSTVSATDALTRGDVAILLYNAFFAETGVPVTTQGERELSDGSIVLETKSTYPTLAEKIFGVLKVEYEAIATPSYTFKGEAETTKSLGYDAVLLDRSDIKNDSTVNDAPWQFYAAAEDLAIDGSADDYIMSHFVAYVTLDADKKVDQILYAEPLMTKKTVNDIKLSTLSSSTKDSYYSEDTGKRAKRLSGEVIIDGQKAYFYNAPYSYAKPSYATNSNEAQKYKDRNEKDLKFIKLDKLGEIEDNEYQYVVDAKAFPYDADDEYFAEASETLIDALAQVYTGGLYEATVYDVDGDGLYDYINYQPYKFAFVDTDKKKTFADDGENGLAERKPTLYTNEANVVGEKFADGDFVIGYWDPDVNYIKIAQVVDPVKTTVKNYKTTTGVVTLANGEKVNAKNAWKLVANYTVGLKDAHYVIDEVNWDGLDALLGSSAYDKNLVLYVVDGDVLYQEGAKKTTNFSTDNLIVITTPKNDDWKRVVSGLEDDYYVYAWHDGETGYVKIDIDAEVYPKLYNGTDFNGDYLNKLATYTVDSKGLYTIQLIDYAWDDAEGVGKTEDDSYLGIDSNEDYLADKDDDSLVWYTTAKSIDGIRKSSTRVTVNGTTYFTDNDTKIVIKVKDEANGNKITVETYDVAKLPTNITNTLRNVQYVVRNNPDYANRNEYLAFLYAETNSKIKTKGTTSSKSQRIVKEVAVAQLDSGEYCFEYVVFNPYTGATETVYGDTVEEKVSKLGTPIAVKSVVDLVGGLIEDSNNDVETTSFYDGDNNYRIVEAFDDQIVVVKEAEFQKVVGQSINKGHKYTAFEDVDGLDKYIVDVADVVVTKLSGNSKDGMFTYNAAYAPISVAQLVADGTDLKGYRTVYDSKGKEKKVYSTFAQIYLEADWETNREGEITTNNAGYNATAEYVVVIVPSNVEEKECDLGDVNF